MAYSFSQPTVTPKYHIEVPTNDYYATPCIFKIWFGSKYYIGKAKSLLPYAQNMAELIERALRTMKYDETNIYYHVITYIKRARIIKAKVEMIHNDFEKNEFIMLKTEQELLNKCKNDVNCLNNNFDSYTPKWMPQEQINFFIKWKEDEANKRNRNKNRTTNPRKKHKGG